MSNPAGLRVTPGCPFGEILVTGPRWAGLLPRVPTGRLQTCPRWGLGYV